MFFGAWTSIGKFCAKCAMNFGWPRLTSADRYVIASALRLGVDAAKFPEAEEEKGKQASGKVATILFSLTRLFVPRVWQELVAPSSIDAAINRQNPNTDTFSFSNEYWRKQERSNVATRSYSFTRILSWNKTSAVQTLDKTKFVGNLLVCFLRGKTCSSTQIHNEMELEGIFCIRICRRTVVR